MCCYALVYVGDILDVSVCPALLVSSFDIYVSNKTSGTTN